ncbi:unnamed protein product [Larinioides sclopetarius]|uniref:Uncharacterized protein n=1 Tax=Larinioides sclopetarius TaxID=280406 RepID=A0AAV2B847_9ARAC
MLDGLELPEVIILLSALLIGENYMHEYPFLKVIPCVVFAAGLMTSIIGILYFFKVAFRILQESKGDYRKKAKLQVYILVFIHAIGNEVCITGWTWSAKISLYFSPVVLPFRVTIGPAENYYTAAHIMTDPLPCLTVGRR